MQNDRPVMVVHGPEIFDRGHVNWLMARIRPKRIIVAGVMARTAAEESGLPVEFAEKPPSLVLGNLNSPAFLANCGKTAESGRIFGQIVSERLHGRGFVHLESSDRVVYVWDNGDLAMGESLSKLTGYRLEEAVSAMEKPGPGIRMIRGCLPGEPVFINGIVIGQATAGTVIIRVNCGVPEPVSGIRIKPHGLEKLAISGPVDPGTAWCKSGAVRRSGPSHKIHETDVPGNGRVLVIDHCGVDIYRKIGEGVAGVLAIGDDTTAVCGHICAHLGIPVFGIVDGDEDGVIDPAYAAGSVIVRVTSGRDDDLGREIAKNSGVEMVNWDLWVLEQLEIIGSRGVIVFPGRKPHDVCDM
jgi:hypothetical protein